MMYRRNTRGRLLLLVFLALSILIITLDFRGSTGPLDRVRDVSQAIVAPIQRGLTTVTRPIGNFFSSLGDLASLREDNRQLTAEVADLRERQAEAETVIQENADLRAAAGLTEPWFKKDRISAEVINEAPGNYKWAVVIDRGSSDGIKEDMAVVTPDGLVGKIIRVDSHQATVLLLIDPDGHAAATTEQIGKSGVTAGNGEGEDLSLEFVPKGTDIGEGDHIVTSNYNGGVFPRGIPIGIVSDVSGDTRAASLDISVTPLVDFSDLEIVQVLRETGQDVSGGGKK
ncbi:MAG: rod shape-determining protein MreC [Actinomycetota bacterium]|jgi:rod shape-determining protein MreC|nr:rod shape-determining protein MreC [Actinomycetota bacterium]